MKKKYKPIHIYCEIYLVNIYLNIDIEWEDYVDYLKENLGIDISHESEGIENCQGKTIFLIYDDTPIISIWLRNKNNIPILIHELFHVASEILNGKGISLTPDTDEVYAYLMSFLTKRALTGIKNKNKKKD